MLTAADIMRETRACFPAETCAGEIAIRDGRISPDLFLPGEWVALRGSRGSDGIHQLNASGALEGVPDETFAGRVTVLRPPESFLRLCAEIIAWDAEHPADGLRRERFAGYEREAAVDAAGLPVDWRHVFAPRLALYRRMYPPEELTW